MNKFDINFFYKYIPEWQEIIDVIHTHPITILNRLIVKIFLFAILPVIFYYNALFLQEIIPFYFLEILLIFVFIINVYDIFDWYNDVWIVTDEWVVWLERSFLKSNTNSLSYGNIEWIWVEQEWIMDKLFVKWDLVIHKIWDDSFILKEAMNPQKSVDVLETIREESQKVDEETEQSKMEMIMEALWWVVWEYMEKWLDKEDMEEIQRKNKQEKINNYKSNKNTIDLR